MPAVTSTWAVTTDFVSGFLGAMIRLGYGCLRKTLIPRAFEGEYFFQDEDRAGYPLGSAGDTCRDQPGTLWHTPHRRKVSRSLMLFHRCGRSRVNFHSANRVCSQVFSGFGSELLSCHDFLSS